MFGFCVFFWPQGLSRLNVSICYEMSKFFVLGRNRNQPRLWYSIRCVDLVKVNVGAYIWQYTYVLFLIRCCWSFCSMVVSFGDILKHFTLFIFDNLYKDKTQQQRNSYRTGTQKILHPRQHVQSTFDRLLNRPNQGTIYCTNGRL